MLRCSIGSGPIPADGSSKEQGRSRSPRRRRRSGGSLLADPLRVDRRRSGPGPGRHHPKRDWSVSELLTAGARSPTINRRFNASLGASGNRQPDKRQANFIVMYPATNECCVTTIMEHSVITLPDARNQPRETEPVFLRRASGFAYARCKHDKGKSDLSHPRIRRSAMLVGSKSLVPSSLHRLKSNVSRRCCTQAWAYGSTLRFP